MNNVIDRAADMTRLWWTCARLATDAQYVVAMRMLGTVGAWSVPRDETTEMLAEKLPAFTEAAFSATFTALSGRGYDRILQAMVEPISAIASDNRMRLADRGPRAFGVDLAPSFKYQTTGDFDVEPRIDPA